MIYGSVKEIYQLLSKGMETDLGIDKAKNLVKLFRTAKTITFVDVPIQQNSDDPLAPFLLAPEASEELNAKF